jgi:ABC-type uncharacterized transport system substrate-binding protein
MLQVLRRLGLGIGLIAAASAILLVSDLKHRADSEAATVAPSTSTLGKTWLVALVQLNQTIDVEEAEEGVLAGIAGTGLTRDRDYRITKRNAHGDMATVNALVDAAVAEGADLIITFSTPTLQAALQRARQTPVVFNYVADPFRAGAGTSTTNHAAHVTGVYLIGAYREMMPLVRQVLPGARVLGTVYVPAEVNMVAEMEVMQTAVRDAGMELRAVAANSAAEVQDAALALVTDDVDAICQIPGNLTAAAFPSIADVARRSRTPMFVFQTSQVRAGATLALARDYRESGGEAGRLAARVMRGESPASIPLVGFAGTKLVVNAAAARELGVAIPTAILDKADEVIGR